MAQHFQIPLAFEFVTAKRKWHAVAFSIAGKEGELREPPKPHVGFPLPTIPNLVSNTDDDLLIRLDKVEESASAFLRPGRLYKAFGVEAVACIEAISQLSQAGREIPESLAEVLASETQEDTPKRKADPWAMREEFLRLEESNVALAAFLNRWGTWEASTALYPVRLSWREYELPRLGKEPAFVLPFLVWRKREAYRAGMLGSPGTWLANEAVLGMTHRRAQFPYIGITDATCSRAIATTVTLDHMRRVKSRICARTDCDNIFPVDSDHGKIYCEQYCGHLVSVRRKRAAAKKASKKTKSKRS